MQTTDRQTCLQKLPVGNFLLFAQKQCLGYFPRYGHHFLYPKQRVGGKRNLTTESIVYFEPKGDLLGPPLAPIFSICPIPIAPIECSCLMGVMYPAMPETLSLGFHISQDKFSAPKGCHLPTDNLKWHLILSPYSALQNWAIWRHWKPPCDVQQ